MTFRVKGCYIGSINKHSTWYIKVNTEGGCKIPFLQRFKSMPVYYSVMEHNTFYTINFLFLFYSQWNCGHISTYNTLQ